ncbi:predicted protein [Streptomyces viridosporus ATCC 14672]|uniref:Predicted protein n=1 Tax=Streptomyces viridosporus (strain ATCC 14672 / DSM 40746 / JCM 4963 / KCTC 9882 / NRRL B-12104 / FH 1290) TaxID=566461 RepID=D5ZUP2_STRV1|nr:predicted protein [Streptomyces viridosporus ATCC 14672]
MVPGPAERAAGRDGVRLNRIADMAGHTGVRAPGRG